MAWAWENREEESRRAWIIKQDNAFCAAMRLHHFPEPVRDVLMIEPTPTVPVERDVLKTDIAPPQPPPEFYQSRSRQIIGEVALKHGLKISEIKASRRTAHLVLARQECCYRLATETLLSLPQIGRLMGGRDHTSVLYSVRRHAYRIGDMERAGPLAGTKGKKPNVRVEQRRQKAAA